MLTHIDIDEKKIEKIKLLTNSKSKKEIIDIALKKYLSFLSAQELLKMKGSNCWEGDLDEMRSI